MLELLNMVINASNSDLLLSRKDCHAKNVSSIVLSQSDGCLTRAFLARPGHELSENQPGGKYTVT